MSYKKLNYNHKKIKSIELNTKNKIYIDTQIYNVLCGTLN